ncbi:hypothetical protein AB0C27_19195 [Nonomuraea sp. NPDC048882]|uniref:hypothetical protein n=1 Tax=Nonomuraea sp. NPDC048882 TaxID=3154347 RepID=UPI00340B9622
MAGPQAGYGQDPQAAGAQADYGQDPTAAAQAGFGQEPPAGGEPGRRETPLLRRRPTRRRAATQGQQPGQRPGVPGYGIPAPQGRAGQGGRHAHPDQQVWPPAQTPQAAEPPGMATQPLPAVGAPALPYTGRRHADQDTPVAGPELPPAVGAEQAMGPGPQYPAGSPQPGMPLPAAGPTYPGQQGQPAHPGQPGEATTAAQQGTPGAGRAASGMSRRRKVLIGVGAVLVSLLITGAQTYDGYGFYTVQTDEKTKEIVVAAGQPVTVNKIEWTGSVKPMKMPPGNGGYGPEVTWLQVDVTKKALDDSSATMTANPRDMKLTDRAGRTWVVEISSDENRPTDRLEVGKAYKILAGAIVPTKVADEVELLLRPSNYRSDTPTEDLFKRDVIEKMPQDTEVLRFRRR